MSAPELEVNECDTILIESNTYMERHWKEISLLDKSGAKIFTLCVWHPDHDKAPDVKVV